MTPRSFLPCLALLLAPCVATAQSSPSTPPDPVPAEDVRRAVQDAMRTSRQATRDAMRAGSRAVRDAVGDEGDDDDDDAPRALRRREGQPERIDTTFAFDPDGTVDLELVSGNIRVTAGSGNRVHIQAESEGGVLELDATRSRVRLDVRGGRHNMGDTRYEVSVPAGVRLLLHSVSGDVEAQGTRGDAEIRTVSGEIQVEDVGRLSFNTVSGDVQVRGASGGAHGSSVSGDVRIERVTGDVDAESTSGEVTIRQARSKVVRIESVSGDLTYEGTIDPDGRYDFHSHSGEITLSLPAGAGARFGMETFSGDVESDFPMTMQPTGRDGGPHQHRFDFTLGGGGARITAQTFSGDIHLRRAQ